MLADVQVAADRIASEDGVEVEWKRIWQIDPIPFDSTLVDLAARGHRRDHGRRGPAAAAVRRPPRRRRGRPAAYPTVMVFSSSIDGVSHSPAEDTSEDDLRVALQAYGRLYDLTADMISEP